MRRAAHLALGMILAAGTLAGSLTPRLAYAAITACSVNMTPHQADAGSTMTFQYTLMNNDPDTIQWVRIARPSSAFTLTSAQASGWSTSLSSTGATFTGGGLDQGDSLTLRVTAVISSSASGTYSWTLNVTDDPGGTGQFACTGDLSVTIGTPGGTPPVISNVAATNLTSTSARITWTTNIPATSQVHYGKSSSYGTSTAPTSSYVTSHSVQLNGLSPSTGYHYKVTSVSQTGGVANSSNNTFMTAADGGSSGGGASPDGGTLAPINQNPTERIPPTVVITTPFNGFYKQAPVIGGRANDNEAIARVEYSVDGGATWLPVDQVSQATTGSGRRRTTSAREVTFQFTPLNLDDGDYMVVVRATDTSSNQGVSPAQRLVIDRLAPQVGGVMVSIGPQVILPREQGVISSVTGIDQKITLSAVGGPTSITLTASVEDNPELTKSFSLAQAKATGLWSGVLSFQHAGVYKLEATAIDGAGNVTKRVLDNVHVAPSASVVASGSNQPLQGVKVTLHYFVPQTNSWAVWDGEAYGQNNPQDTDEEGRFQYFLPPGKYYLEMKKGGRRSTNSHIFELDQPTPITSTLPMKPGLGFQVGPLPLYVPIWSAVKLNLERDLGGQPQAHALIDQRLPAFKLPRTDGRETNTLDLAGKPTLISFVTTWSPASKDQLQVLSALQQDQTINIVPVAVQDPLQRVSSYLTIAGYKLAVTVDKDGTTVAPYKLQGLPSHYLVDRSGVIKKVMVGVLSEEEIRKEVGR
jgi:peroxiredoxin